MSALSLAAMAIALLAVAGLAVHLADHWFCALLALASLLGAIDAAFSGRLLWVILLLILGAGLSGASLHAAYATGREQRSQG
ncbi:hypothetical protein ACF1BS_04440 [Streptomyces sp. NPDC014748]|uniref:hypothetical protein n=1 Tax=Streptomyces sp. NPDC014748 TaxID=3364905 RepID=UPI0037004C24